MDILVFSGLLLLGLVLLYYGAEWLVGGSSQVALGMGISPLVVGLTVVAFGTSAPELLVSVQANLMTPPQGNLALGNIVGSNICNIGLILGVGALLVPLKAERQVIRRELPILLLVSVIFLWMQWDRQISRVEAGALTAGILFYVWSSLRLARRESKAGWEAQEEKEASEQKGKAGMLKNVGFILLGLGVLVAGADFLIKGGVGLAKEMGVPEVVIGLTLVALGTSLPELATTAVAAMKGEGDLIIGNALGSCLFNLMAVVGIAGLISPLSAGGLGWIDLGVMLGLTVLAFVFMWFRKPLNKIEGAVFLLIYLAYCSCLVMN